VFELDPCAGKNDCPARGVEGCTLLMPVIARPVLVEMRPSTIRVENGVTELKSKWPAWSAKCT